MMMTEQQWSGSNYYYLSGGAGVVREGRGSPGCWARNSEPIYLSDNDNDPTIAQHNLPSLKIDDVNL